jgi:hypothetical protein
MINMSSSSELSPVEGNYPGCIAAIALEHGINEGNPSELIEGLEQIAEVCPHTTQGTDEGCLLAPVAANIGLVAIESGAGQWWLTSQVTAANRLRYPKTLLGRKVRDFDDSPECLDYSETIIPITVTDQSPAIPVSDGKKARSLQYLQSSADPGNSSYLEMFLELRSNEATPETHALIAIKDIVMMGLVDNRPGISASMAVDGNLVTLKDHIDGLMLHGNRSTDSFRGPDIPQDRIILPWPRTRSVEVELTPADIRAFTHTV